MDDCHCRSCRSCSAGPVNAFTRWQPDSVKVARRAEFVGHFRTTETRDRPFCTRCGGHLMTDHPPPGLTDVCAATIPSRAFVPGFHVNHAEIVLPIKHGLPELRGFSAELDGSAQSVPEWRIGEAVQPSVRPVRAQLNAPAAVAEWRRRSAGNGTLGP